MPMFSKEQTRWVLGCIVPFMVVIGILHLCGYHKSSFGNPINLWIILLIWIGNLFYDWKDKKELLKRLILSLPFALLIVMILGLTVFNLSNSWSFGILMFFFLTGGKENLEQHFTVRLVTGAILIALLAVLIVLIRNTMGLSS